MQPFPHESILTTLAELSIAIVGFSMLASVFRGSTGNERVRFLGFRDVAEIGLISAVGSLAPQLFDAFGLEQATSWRWGTGVFGVLFVIGGVASMRKRGRSNWLALRETPIRFVLIVPCTLTCFLLILANLFLPSESSGARHVLAVSLSLGTASLMFMVNAFDVEF